MMPKFTKVRRVPKPDSQIFEKFEQFLHKTSKRDNTIIADVTEDSADKTLKKQPKYTDPEDLYEKIIESKEYLECKFSLLINFVQCRISLKNKAWNQPK